MKKTNEMQRAPSNAAEADLHMSERIAATNAVDLTDARILQIASEVGLKVRTGQGAIAFARAVLADRAAAVEQAARHE
jgi:hypothetical protein